MKKTLNFIKLIALLLVLCTALSACSLLEVIPGLNGETPGTEEGKQPGTEDSPGSDETLGEENQELPELPLYEERNGNVPYFTADEIKTTSFEHYSELDSLGRCGVVTACIGKDIMPEKDEDRGSISSVTPSGWIQAKYAFVPGKYLYHRSHLIGWQLTAENANKKNLITGTEYMNTDGMLPFENMVAAYIKETNNHVMYRVTPDFQGNNLVATGVLIEALSVEDNGKGVSFCVYVFNHQPGVTIDYSTGKSSLSSASNPDNNGGGNGQTPIPESKTYVLNTSSMKFHLPECTHAKNMSDKNKQTYTGTRDDLIAEKYTPCGTCNP